MSIAKMVSLLHIQSKISPACGDSAAGELALADQVMLTIVRGETWGWDLGWFSVADATGLIAAFEGGLFSQS